MANTILHKRSATGGSIPTAGSLSLGEIAINTTDGAIYLKKGDGTVIRAGVDLEAVNLDILPDADITRSLGSATHQWKDVFVGPGSLYVNGQKVLEENSGTIVLSADDDQNIQVKSGGAGDIEFYPADTGVIQMKGTLSVLAGKHFTSSDANPISVAVGFDMNNENITNVATPTQAADAATKGYADGLRRTDGEIRGLLSGGGDVNYNATTGEISVTSFTTSNARTAISVTDAGGDGALSYNNASGVITYTGPSASDVRSHFSDGTGVTITAGAVSIGQSVATTASPTFAAATITGGVTNSNHAATKAYVDSAITSVGDADTLDGQEGTYYLDMANATNKPDPTITLGGDLTGNATLTDLGNATLTAAVVDDSHNHTTASASFAVTSNLTVGGSAVINGDLTVSGTTTSVNTTAVEIADVNIELASGATDNATANGSGLTFGGHATAATLTYNSGTDAINFNNASGGITAPLFTGAVTGNATTATTLQTARNIALTGDVTGSASFNGSANATITATVANNSHTHTSANITDATNANTANMIVKRDASGNFSAGTVTAALTGNASTATTLQTARTINGVSFNGSANITVEPYISDDDTGDTNCPVVFSPNSTAGYKRLYEDSAFYYNNTNNIVHAGTFSGTATQAQYADLAEIYAADDTIEPGTVVSFGGVAEVTASEVDGDRKIAGVVSTNPAYLMNSTANGVPVALQGRVPCKVTGTIERGDMLVSAGNGMARAEEDPKMGSVIGKALTDSEGDAVIEIVVGRL